MADRNINMNAKINVNPTTETNKALVDNGDNINTAFGKVNKYLSNTVQSITINNVPQTKDENGNVNLDYSATDTTYTFTNGINNGTFQVKASNSEQPQEVSIGGLGNAAYTDTNSYATSAQGTKADSAIQGVQFNNGAIMTPDANKVIELPNYPTTLPASDVYPWAKEENKPTYTASEVNAVTFVNNTQDLNDTQKANARENIGAGTSNFNGNFGALDGIPTTIAGYGITDAKIENNTITLGSNSKTFVETEANKTLMPDNLIENNKISTAYIPDYILGQVLYGGTVNASAVATLSNGAKSKLGTTSNTITLTNNTTAITGYVDNEGIYYIATANSTFAGLDIVTGDWLISTGSSWTKVDNTDAVKSVNGKTGVITLNAGDVGAVDVSVGVTNVAYNSTNKAITQTINGTTSNVVTAATLKSDMNITASDVGAVRYDTNSQNLTSTQKSNARTNLGLSNVENKSSATIRSELTSSNVTTALGYTPLVNNANVAVTGAVEGSGIFNNGAISVVANRKCGLAQHNASGTSATPWYKVADVTLAIYRDYTITFYVDSGLEGSANNVGILRVYTRMGASLQSPEYLKIRWLLTGADVNLNNFALSYDKSTGVCAIYANCVGAYTSYRFTVMSESDVLNRKDLSVWTVYNAMTGIASLPTGDNVVTVYSELATTQVGSQSIKSTNIDRTTNPSSYKIGESQLVYRDTNGKAIGAFFPFRSTNGDEWVSFYAYNETTSGTQVNNAFELGVTRDGTAKYQVSSPSAFRDAIDAAYDVQCDYNTNNGVKNLCNLDWFNTDNVFQNAYVESTDINSGKLIAYTPASDTTHTYCGVNVYSKFNDILENGKTYTLSWTVDSLTNNGLFGFRRTSSNAYITPTSGTYNVNATGDAYYTFTYDSSIPVYLSLCVNTSATSSLKRIVLSNIMLREAIITDSTFVPYAEPNYILTRNSKLYKVSDTTPYLYKTSEHDAVYDELVGASVNWNQLAKPISSWGYANIDVSTSSNGVMTINGTASGTTYPVLNDTEYSVIGHKYLMTLHRTDLTTSITLQGAGLNMSNGTKIQNATDSGKWYIRIMSGTVCDNIKVTPQIIDLTQMFGPTIADYVYSLEQSTAGSGIAWLKSYGFFTKDYYAYNAGALTSVNVSGKRVVGKNLLDASQIVVGSIGGQGQDISSNTRLRTAYISVLPNTTYTAISGNNVQVYEYHEYRTDKSHIKFVPINATSGSNTMSPDTHFIRLLFRYSDNRIMEVSDMPNPQLELGSTATDYEPYTSITYPMQSTDLRGLYKLNGTKLYTDGDIYSADGTVTRKYGIVDLGTLDWVYDTSYANPFMRATFVDGISGSTNMICSKGYTPVSAFVDVVNTNLSMCIVSNSLRIRDDSYTDAATFKSAMSGVYLIYELATPTTVPASPYTSPQMVYRNGTEEYLDTRDVPMPVGGNRKYVDIPEWMVNEYFDDWRGKTLSTTGGTMTGNIIFGEDCSILSSNETTGVDSFIGFDKFGERITTHSNFTNRLSTFIIRPGEVQIEANDGVTGGQDNKLSVNYNGVFYNSDKVATITNNAGYHNSIFRGKYLGNSYTTTQKGAVQLGTFDDLYIGDYWTIGGINYRIAHFDYYLNTGDTQCTTHHIVVVPDYQLATSYMNSTGTAAGGYAGSYMNTTTLLQDGTETSNSVVGKIKTAFGVNNLLSIKQLFSSSVDSSDNVSAWGWYSSKCWLMNQCNVYGQQVWANNDGNGYNTGIDKSQYALFKLAPQYQLNYDGTSRDHYWLRDVSSSSAFVYNNYSGYPYINIAYISLGVRPAFLLC